MKVKIAVAQMKCKMGDVRANLEAIKNIAANLSRHEPNIVCFPELATTGYSLNEKWRKYAEEIPGKTSEHLSKIANELGAYLISGVDELDPKNGKIYDSAILISPQGKVTGVYRKVHLWDKERKYFTRGSEFPVFETKFGKVGLGICYDIEFPEPARAMASRGADILFFPSAEMTPMERYIDTYALSRASENCCFLGFSNRIGIEGKTHFFGHSQIVSPECKVLAMATKTRPFSVAEIDLEVARKLAPKLPYLSQLVPEVYKRAKISEFRAQKRQK